MTRHLSFLIAAALLGAAVHTNAQWPQFRGERGDGTAPGQGLPITWSEEKNIRWRTAVRGRAWSSPVILDGQVWMTTATEDGRELAAIALDQESGKIVQDVIVFRIEKPPEWHPFNSYASPTPALEPGRAYVHFGSLGTAAVDTRSGKVLWERRDLRCDHFRGAGSSPIIFRNLLIMHFDGIDVQYVIALDKATGRTVWKTPRSIDFMDLDANGKPQGDGDFRKAFATPHIVTTGGEPLLVSLGGKAIYGYDPLTGKERWRIVDRTSHSASARPVDGHGLVFYPTGWENSKLVAIRPNGKGDVTSTHVAWRFTRAVPNKPSVVMLDDLIYMINDSGIATCLEAKTGTLVWQSRIGGTFSASPVAVPDRIYFFDEDGLATVIAAGREFKILAQNQLDNGFMATPAVAGNALFVRTTHDVYRVEGD